MDTPENILRFWFEGVDDTTPIRKKHDPFRKWFAGGRAFDQEIRERFEPLLLKAAEGGCDAWKDTAQGTLALILLFDQFPRNMYRNTPAMYRYDPLAAALSMEAVARGMDQELQRIERMFLYMPLMHAEDAGFQQVSIHCFARLAREAERGLPENISYFKSNLDYALKYCDIIGRFGHFPHRRNRGQTPISPNS